MAFASAYWFRGTPQSESPVLQGDVAVDVALERGSLGLSVWGNMQLSNSTGDAFLPDDNAHEFSEIDLVTSYSTSFGPVSVDGGMASYNFPNTTFQVTHELYLSAGFDTGPLYHALAVYYDVDSITDWYLNYGLSSSWQLDDAWSFDAGGMLGYMGDEQAAFYFGATDGGFSDASASATLNYFWDELTTVYLDVSGMVVPDSGLRDTLDAAGVDSSGVWTTLGVSFSL